MLLPLKFPSNNVFFKVIQQLKVLIFEYFSLFFTALYISFQAYFLNWENWVQVGIIINVLLISFHTNPMESLTEPIHLIEPWQHHAAAIGVFLGKFGKN